VYFHNFSSSVPSNARISQHHRRSCELALSDAARVWTVFVRELISTTTTKRIQAAIGNNVSPRVNRNLAKIEFIIMEDNRGFLFRRIITVNGHVSVDVDLYIRGRNASRKYLGRKIAASISVDCFIFVTRSPGEQKLSATC